MTGCWRRAAATSCASERAATASSATPAPTGCWAVPAVTCSPAARAMIAWTAALRVTAAWAGPAATAPAPARPGADPSPPFSSPTRSIPVNPRTTTLLAAAVALVLGATGCGAAKTATKAVDDVAIAKSEPGEDLLPLGRGVASPYIDYGTANQAKPTKVG